jgi:hypothetical protein
MRNAMLVATLAIITGSMMAQSDEMVAYVPANAPARTADDARINFLDPVVPGTLEVSLPQGTHTVDILNARGRVKRTMDVTSLDRLDIHRLRKGTWTLRAHTGKGMVVRRFLVLGRGHIMWEQPRIRRR